MNKSTFAAALAVVLPPAIAQGPDRSLVPADASFVVHVDLQRTADVLGLDDLMDEVLESEGRRMLRRMEDRWGFDPREDIRSVTVFGSDLSGRDPGVFFITTDALDDALEALEDDGALRTESQGGLRFHRISAQGLVDSLGLDVEVGDESLVVHVKRIQGDRRAVLVGERIDRILDAARVFDDEDLSLARARDADLELRTSARSMVYVEAVDSLEELLGRSPASRLADKIRGLALDVSEERDTLQVRLTVATGSERDARDVESIINGLRGLLSLAEGLQGLDELPALVRGVLDELDADADQNRVTVSLSLPVAEIRQALRDR
jgi:hypothetical protein